jgi:hypothetical protein
VITLLVFFVNDKNSTDLNLSHFFCALGLKMSGPQQWQEVALDLLELFRGKIFVLFCCLGLVFVTPVFTFFCTIFVIHEKKLTAVSPFSSWALGYLGLLGTWAPGLLCTWTLGHFYPRVYAVNRREYILLCCCCCCCWCWCWEAFNKTWHYFCRRDS